MLPCQSTFHLTDWEIRHREDKLPVLFRKFMMERVSELDCKIVTSVKIPAACFPMVAFVQLLNVTVSPAIME